MVELLRGCSIICSAHDAPAIGKNSFTREESFHPSFCCLDFVPRKQVHSRSAFTVNRAPLMLVFAESGKLSRRELLEMPRTINFPSSSRRDFVALAYCESGVALGQKISLSTLHEEVGSNTNGCLQKQLPLVSPLTQQGPGAEAVCSPSSSRSERLFELSKGNLHFLEERDEELLSNRILILSRSNKVQSALEMFASMEASGLHPNAHACNSFVASLVRNGSLENALLVFEIMNKKGTASSHTFSLILNAMARTRGCSSALEMFYALEEEGMSKIFDVVVYNTMISICGKARNWVETQRIWRMLKQSETRGTMITYDLLVSNFVQCGQLELAVDAYHEMIQSGLIPSEDILKAILSSCTKEGKWDLGLKFFQKMLDSGFKPNIIAFNSMINCLGKAGKDDLAFEVYDLLKRVGHKPDGYTWSALLCALYRSNRYADAIRLFESIKTEEGCDLNVHLYDTVLMACQRLGWWERSLQLLWVMEKSGVEMSTASYNHAISACEVAREPKVALQIYQHMIAKKHAPDTFTYLSLIRSCIWGSLWNDIEEIVESVGPNCSLYNALIQGLCLRGEIVEAKKMYKKMRSIGLKPDGKTRALMLQHLSNDRRRR